MAVPSNLSGAGTEGLGVALFVDLSSLGTRLLVVSESSSLVGVGTGARRVADPLSLNAFGYRTQPGRIKKALPRSLNGTGSLSSTVGTLSFSLSLSEDTLKFPPEMKAEGTVL